MFITGITFLKVSLGSLLLLTLTIAAEEREPSTEAAIVFVTPSNEPKLITSTPTTTTTTKRTIFSPLRFTFPPRRTDQQRSQTKQRTSEKPITLNIPATYESIVYNPDSKEATSIFSISNFWDTPESTIQETNQQQVGKNSIITKSSRSEFSPNYHRSVQTPLAKIQYRQPSPVAEEETDEEESQVEENVENDDDQEEKPAYPVQLQDEKFQPFQTSDYFYGDVLNNIGSIFTDEENKDSVKTLLPQFDENSFENLQQHDRSDDFVEENENAEDYDQVENEETQAVTQPPVQTETPVVAKQSPFPSVKIIRNATMVPKQKKLVFSPWLPVPTNAPKVPKTWPVTTTTTPRPLKKFSAKRPKKAAKNLPVSATSVPAENGVAQKIDDLYNDQHKHV